MENLKIPHRILLLHYGKSSAFAGKNIKLRNALAEAVIHEANLMHKIRIDESEIIHAGTKHTSGHSIIDQVADQISIAPGKSVGHWIKQLAANDTIALHVTENLINNQLLKAHKNKGLFRKKPTTYSLNGKNDSQLVSDYLKESAKSDARSTISLAILTKHEI
ncbi:MAG: hypothetical protein PF448_11355 [Bacteroidales bacterium]|jgi:hypothetical protein|nr:hypothetical protein [Bacteroidales bacterium]